ncbi:DUF4382 domain-containing protein [Formosa sp. S-31]
MKSLNAVFLAVLAIVTFSSCESNDDKNTASGISRISVKLMDNPGDYEHVYVDVQDVLIKTQDTDNEEEGWESLEAINTGVYDLLELTGGLNVLLVDDYDIPSGDLKEIRLLLGDENTIVINGDSKPLKTPSAQQSGLKIKVNEYLEPNIHYTFLLDFDVDQSIVEAGDSGNINLKPVIRASVEANTGAISGKVVPAEVQTLISATNGVDVISAYANVDGEFLLLGLEPGTYTLSILPDVESEFLEQTIEGVEVNLEETTDVGEVNLQ